MSALRGEEQAGFTEILGNWLDQQPWVPPVKGRRTITRVGGLRLPRPDTEADPQAMLEVHIFEVPDPSSEAPQGRTYVNVPVTLRTRPSAAAGKSAFIGKLHDSAGQELWVYDGARDPSCLAALAEMARRRQGSRNGRSRGRALGDFDKHAPLGAQARRRSEPSPTPWASRTVLVAEADSSTEAGQALAVDILRRPQAVRDTAFDTALVLTEARSSAVAQVWGVISAAWQESESGSATATHSYWESAEICVIRESSGDSDHAEILAQQCLQAGEPFTQQARGIGLALGAFHADVAGAFGAYPQTPDQLKRSAAQIQQGLVHQWSQVKDRFDEDESSDITEVIDVLSTQLKSLDEPVQLQRIHGYPGLADFRKITDQRWVISEAGGMVDHAAPAVDVVSVLMSAAEAVMAAAQQGTSGPVDAAPEAPLNFGDWYEAFTTQFMKAYRETDADHRSVDSVLFRAQMLTECLALFARWEGQWVFRPALLLNPVG